MLHMIGNAHLDPVWLWRWPEGCAEAIATCWSAVDRLEEDPGLIFTRGEALIYRWIERLDPPLFARIRDFVAEGRWVIVNGWWVQPDCNLPCGEAVVRQALYGKRWFAERFNVDISVGYNVDSFGHAATLPMLLRHTGSDSYVFMRPGPHEMALPADLFDWISADGSRVRAFRIQVAYMTAARTMPLPEKIDLHLQRSAAAGHPFMCFYGIGNHGGGPTREALALIHARQAAGEPLLLSDPVKYFAAVRHLHVPEVATELQFHAIGCYSAVSAIKAQNRRAESLLYQAEAAAALAFRHADADYPTAEFAALWQELLFNQFHDTLGGCAIETACTDAVHAFGAVITGTQALLNDAVRALARTIRRMEDPRDAQFLLFNFNDLDWDGLAEIHPWTEFDTATPRALYDENGHAVAFQRIDAEGARLGLQRIACRLRVPAFGYRLLRFAVSPAWDEATAARIAGANRPVPATQTFQTTGWQMRIDPDGAIASLVNRRHGTELFTGPAHRGIVVEDATDTWSHGVDRFPIEGISLQLHHVSVLERGPVRLVVEICAGHGNSRLTTTVILPEDPDLPVELRVSLDWREHNRLLRLAYQLDADRVEYEIPAGWIAREADGREYPGQRWVRALRPDFTVAIANDAKYSYAAAAGTLFITAVRSPPFAHHDPMKLEPGVAYRHIDQGEQRFTRLLQGAPELSRREAMRLADGLLRPPVTTPHVARGGTSPWRGQFLRPDSATSALTALKCSEDGQALVLRAVNLEDHGDRLVLDGTALDIPARGILTARLDRAGLHRSDGLER